MGIFSKAKIDPDLEHWDKVIEPHCHLLDLMLDLFFSDLVHIMLDADLELIGLNSPGDGAKIIKEHHSLRDRLESHSLAL